jgi:hypothetical protein
MATGDRRGERRAEHPPSTRHQNASHVPSSWPRWADRFVKQNRFVESIK